MNNIIVHSVWIYLECITGNFLFHTQTSRLAQSVEHLTLNPRVVGWSPTLGQGIFGGQDRVVVKDLNRASYQTNIQTFCKGNSQYVT